MANNGNKTFMRVTNKDISDKLDRIAAQLVSVDTRVKIHTKLIIVGGVIISFLTGLLFKHIGG